MRTKSLLVPLAIAAASAATPALADFKGGDFIVRVGAAYMDLTDDALSRGDTFFVEDPIDPDAPLIPVTVDTFLDLDDDTTWFINGTLFVADHWAVELGYMDGADLDTNVVTSISAPDYGQWSAAGSIGSFDTNVSTLFVNWYPVCVESWVQPYVGIGVNYTDIDQDYLRTVDLSFVGPDGEVVRDPGGLVNFGSSFSWAAQVGVDIEFGRNANWLFNASAKYIDADPRVEIGFDAFEPVNGDGVSVRVNEDMEYDSWIFNLGVGYKFSF
ncbi:OmpW/AlkL family protein [Microbulbifer pacificus]|uniref:OmpW family outer membrane protein n=1 Tax=Microbulbifer pacificus TaxID=407164 RepID=A0AAU0N176_9GAMM|nr:OmpW family outer membrane protein [Microbulbifer pacificus]WOX06017.1 OmpW family outer membrane protein [Microbulbifer pacificus]